MSGEPPPDPWAGWPQATVSVASSSVLAWLQANVSPRGWKVMGASGPPDRTTARCEEQGDFDGLVEAAAHLPPPPE